MRVIVQAQVTFTGVDLLGAADIRLTLERNGVPVDDAYYSEGPPLLSVPFLNNPVPETLQLDTTVDCKKGDQLTIRLTGSQRTRFADYAYYFSQKVGDMWAAFTPDSAIHLGDLWPVAPNPPTDISQTDMVLTVAKMLCGTFTVNEQRRTVGFTPFDLVVDNISSAVDWSAAVSEEPEPEHTPRLEPYGLNNLCKWKQADEKPNVGYGDGIIKSPLLASPKETELFELPFMACIDSETLLGGYGNPILIKTRTVKGYGDNQTVDSNDAAPRLVLIEPTKVVTVQTEVFDTETDTRKVPVTLTACWWGKRPAGVKTADNGFSLAFSALPGQGEQALIPRYFTALERVLRRPRMLTLSVYLSPADVSTLDLSRPVRLKQVRLGSFNISDNWFYINKLGPYRSGMPTTATLIAL